MLFSSTVSPFSREGERCRADSEARAVGLGRVWLGGLALTVSPKVTPVRERSVDVRLAVLRGCRAVVAEAVAAAVDEARRRRKREG